MEGARAVCVDLVVFRFEVRMSTTCRLARRGPYLGRQLDFLKNSFSGGCLGTIPGGDTHFQAPGVTGGCFIREKPRKISFFASFEALPSTATHPNLGQISIFLAHIDGHSMGIHHNFQSGGLANCGRSYGRFEWTLSFFGSKFAS